MSRVGKHSIPLSSDVKCQLENGKLSLTGKLGTLQMALSREVSVAVEDNQIKVVPGSGSKQAINMWGTTQRLIKNLLSGVTVGFVKDLEINGVGYRAQVQGNKLVMQLGFSHDIELVIPEGLKVEVEKQTMLKIRGIDKQKVGQFAAEVRQYRPPEPYKGKGIKYAQEVILRKEGKKK